LCLPSFTQGDYITVVLDMDSRTISFGKNGEEPRLAFEDVDATELYPCVMFYSTNPGEKVRYCTCAPWYASIIVSFYSFDHLLCSICIFLVEALIISF
jgi:hypothetical protein